MWHCNIEPIVYFLKFWTWGSAITWAVPYACNSWQSISRDFNWPTNEMFGYHNNKVKVCPPSTLIRTIYTNETTADIQPSFDVICHHILSTILLFELGYVYSNSCIKDLQVKYYINRLKWSLWLLEQYQGTQTTLCFRIPTMHQMFVITE